MQGKLRIAIDGYNLSLRQGTGVATYARNLSRALRLSGAEVYPVYGKRFSRSREVSDEIGFFDSFKKERGGLVRLAANRLSDLVRSAPILTGLSIKARPIQISGIVNIQQLQDVLPEWDDLLNIQGGYQAAEIAFALYRRLASLSFEKPIDIFHSTYPLPVMCRDAAQVCTIHDLVPLILPFTTLENKTVYSSLVKQIINKYDFIFTVSESTKQDIVRLFGAPENKIWVTWQGVTIPDRYLAISEEDIASFLKSAYGLTAKRYYLFVGAIEPKKNIGRLLEAYFSADVDLPLVIVGKKGWLFKNEIKLLNQPGRSNSKVIRIPYLPFESLARLYRGARALIFPSLYEGFGLPPLEAMLMGCPVITSNTSSLPEVCGDAALYIDPYNVHEIADAIRVTATDEKLCNSMVEKGYRQAQNFSMEKYAHRLKEGYLIAMGNNNFR